MKNQLTLLLLAASLLGAFSCKKSDSSPSTGNNCTLSKITFNNPDTSITTFHFDGSGKVINDTTIKNKAVVYYNEYTYSGNTITHTTGANSPEIDCRTNTYTIGANGYPSLKVVASTSGSGSQSLDSTIYSYDANGYLTKSVEVQNFGSRRDVKTTTYTYSGGNLMSKATTLNQLSNAVITSYTYNSTLNKAGILGNNDNLIPLGKANANLQQSGGRVVTSYAYVLDNNGYITQATRITVYGGNAYTAMISFTYNCK